MPIPDLLALVMFTCEVQWEGLNTEKTVVPIPDQLALVMFTWPWSWSWPS